MKKNTPTMNSAVWDLQAANKRITKRHKYSCGLEADSIQTRHNGTVRAFFSSPDYQNEELYHDLKSHGYTHSMYEARYYWRVRRGDMFIAYTEGDIDIYTTDQLEQAERDRMARETTNRPRTCSHCGRELDKSGMCTAPLSVAD